MQNDILDRVAQRTLERHRDVYADEVGRLVDAAYTVMRRTESVDPRVGDIVREAGLSNAAFYRHFSGKDELLVVVLEDGRRRLVATLERRLAAVSPGAARVRRWVETVVEQARNVDAAANTRPFAVDGARLADRFPTETARSRELLVKPLRDAVAEAGGDTDGDASAIYHLAIGTMHDALVERRTPSRADVEHLVAFALRGMSRAAPDAIGRVAPPSRRSRPGYAGTQRARP